MVFKSSFGLRLRATGENPLAVDTTAWFVKPCFTAIVENNSILPEINKKDS